MYTTRHVKLTHQNQIPNPGCFNRDISINLSGFIYYMDLIFPMLLMMYWLDYRSTLPV